MILKLQDARTEHTSAQEAAKEHHDRLLQKRQQFEIAQRDLDKKILVASLADTADEAVQGLESSVIKLQRLEVAHGYVDQLQQADHLIAEAQRGIAVSPQHALEPYNKLRKLTQVIREQQVAVEDATPQLIHHLEEAGRKLWSNMRGTLEKDFESLLREIGWPTKDAVIAGTRLERWTESYQKLVALQLPQLRSQEEIRPGIPLHRLEPLLPLQTLVRPLALRFKYHFSGEKPTNRLDRPEYFLSHFTDLIYAYYTFVNLYIRPTLEGCLSLYPDLLANPLYSNAQTAFITALLPMLRTKTTSVLPQLSSQPQLLSHFIHELIRFDTELIESYDYLGGSHPWQRFHGITHEVLVEQNWFPRWLHAEKTFALKRFDSLMDTKDGSEIDYESLDSHLTKPTRSALRVKGLLETITERYRPLPSFEQKLRFLLDIQINILDLFHEKLHASNEAFLVLTSSIARAVQSISAEEAASASGVGGLERLCRVYGSAEYMENAMGDWSDDLFFLELWDDLHNRAVTSTSTDDPTTLHVAGVNGAAETTFDVADLARHTSPSLLDETHTGTTGALFDETASAYRTLKARTEELMVAHMTKSLMPLLKAYTRTCATWTTAAPPDSDPVAQPDDADAEVDITQEMQPLIQHLRACILFLARAVNAVALRRLCRAVLNWLETQLWDRILLRSWFSFAGAVHFRRDVAELQRVAFADVRGLGEEFAMRAMGRLGAGVRLLALVNGGDLEDQDSAADRGGDGLEVERDSGGQRITLERAEKLVFENNESARGLLAEMGIGELVSEQEARAILERRVELST